MVTSDFISAFLIGIAGSVHCIAMCGGVTAGLSLAIPKGKQQLPFIFAYNLGRITSYSIAGGLAGALSSILSHQLQDGIAWLNLLSGLFLLLMAAYIGNWWPILSQLERIGGVLWRRISPLSKRFMPFKHPLYALPYGLIWGWLPCGLVYSSLTWSLASGNATNGALSMFFFGLGTLPSMILAAYSATQVTHLLKKPRTKQLIALILALFGILNISQSLANIL
ncbi:sulfite exporter TauE/SafE family protein [Alteromonas sp. a30]|uniref:sulfite exporter TauE/SafE family protein n=1 Tax=Alteromonas sp. a30 TaxID=2730917 RepID=UPI00228060AF|nr:sulfite exporter TauE/SafE family protein [Alteromonas sp. a30]MCY7293869.1 sulfite exporter TauE/SafE family protein [Alteromonas sp. a30]